jgi:RNA polymerase sigma-70 factor (ECF subfamily)
MGQAADPVRIETLLAHAGWLRALARHLVSDRLSADDVVQDTYLAALEHPPRKASGARAWLAAVARNVVRARGRSDARRARREERARPPGSDPGPSETLEKLELHERLVTLVRELDEPERTTVLMRYFEGMRPNEIAARTGVPASTVRSRLQRAIGRLRARLDSQEGGDRRAWCLAFLPLAGLESLPALPTAASLAMGGLIMSAKIKLAAGVAVLVLAALLVWRTVGTPEDPPGTSPAPRPDVAVSDERDEEDRPVEVAPAPEEIAPSATEERSAEVAPRDGGADAPASPRPPRAGPVPVGVVTGTVKLHDGSPPHEVEIVLERVPQRDDPEGAATEYPATPDAQGRFRVDGLPPGSYWLEVGHPDLAGIRKSVYVREDRGAGPYDIVLHPGGTLLVRVLDAGGAPMPGQSVNYAGPSWASGQTDEEGVFRAERLPMGSYKVKWFAAGAETTRTVTISPGRTTEVVFSRSTALLGTVYGPEGRPLGDSLVRLHPLKRGEGYRVHQTRTKSDGGYEAVGFLPGKYRVSVQVLPGPGRPGYVCDVMEVEVGEGVRLTQDLHVAPTAIEGRVTRKDDGTPLSSFPQQVQISAWRVTKMEDGKVVERGSSIMAFADKEGRYAFRGIEPGKYQIWIAPFVRDLREEWRVVDVPLGGLRDVDFALEVRRLGTLRLRVTAPDGASVEKLMFATVVGNASTSLHPTGRASGGVYVFRLEAGTRSVTAMREGFRTTPDQVTVEIEEGKTVEARLTMVRLGAVVLKVTEPNGLPAKAIRVVTIPAGGKPRGAYARPKGEGTFLVWLEPGKATLRVETETGVSDPLEITAAPDVTVEEEILLRAR